MHLEFIEEGKDPGMKQQQGSVRVFSTDDFREDFF
jgi:hypothetical protein